MIKRKLKIFIRTILIVLIILIVFIVLLYCLYISDGSTFTPGPMVVVMVRDRT